MTKFTPGPWERWKGHSEVFANVRKNNEGSIQGVCVARCDGDDLFDDDNEDDQEYRCEDEAFANAALIAAAPELYEGLFKLLEWCESTSGPPPFVHELRASLSKVRG